MFVLNPTARAIAADIVFVSNVEVGDLALLFGASGASERPEPAQRFALEVPSNGILPLAVDGLNHGDARERGIATTLSEQSRQVAERMADSELPGFKDTSAWN